MLLVDDMLQPRQMQRMLRERYYTTLEKAFLPKILSYQADKLCGVGISNSNVTDILCSAYWVYSSLYCYLLV